MRRGQAQSYKIPVDDQVQSFLTLKTQSALSDTELYKRSLAILPRKKPSFMADKKNTLLKSKSTVAGSVPASPVTGSVPAPLMSVNMASPLAASAPVKSMLSLSVANGRSAAHVDGAFSHHALGEDKVSALMSSEDESPILKE